MQKSHSYFRVIDVLFHYRQSAGITPSQAIFSILVKLSRSNFTYKLHLCKTMQRLRVPPNRKILELIDTAVKRNFEIKVQQVKSYVIVLIRL